MPQSLNVPQGAEARGIAVMAVAPYARVSRDRQDTDLSISGQLRALREYTRQHGHEVVREFIDEAESGRSADRRTIRY